MGKKICKPTIKKRTTSTKICEDWMKDVSAEEESAERNGMNWKNGRQKDREFYSKNSEQWTG